MILFLKKLKPKLKQVILGKLTISDWGEINHNKRYLDKESPRISDNALGKDIGLYWID